MVCTVCGHSNSEHKSVTSALFYCSNCKVLEEGVTVEVRLSAKSARPVAPYDIVLTLLTSDGRPAPVRRIGPPTSGDPAAGGTYMMPAGIYRAVWSIRRKPTESEQRASPLEAIRDPETFSVESGQAAVIEATFSDAEIAAAIQRVDQRMLTR